MTAPFISEAEAERQDRIFSLTSRAWSLWQPAAWRRTPEARADLARRIRALRADAAPSHSLRLVASATYRIVRRA